MGWANGVSFSQGKRHLLWPIQPPSDLSRLCYPLPLVPTGVLFFLLPVNHRVQG